MPNGETVRESVAHTTAAANGLGFMMIYIPLGPERKPPVNGVFVDKVGSHPQTYYR